MTGDSVGDLAAFGETDEPLASTHSGLVVVPGLTDAPPVAVAVQPIGGPVTIGAGGGSFHFRVTLTNHTGQAQSFQAWSAVTGPVNREPVVGPMNVTLPAGSTVTRTLRQQVPGNAPAGAYTYHVKVGTFGGMILASDSFPFTKEGSALAARSAADPDWAGSRWDEAAAAGAQSLPEGLELSAVHPNPSRGDVRLTLEVAEAQRVLAEVYDALGRRVAVLLNAVLLNREAEVGTHALVLDG